MKHAIILASLFGIAFVLVHNKISSSPYVYDEADYMFAASLGAEANWLDIGTMPITEFVTAGLHGDPDAKQKSALSALARRANDPVAYRHWHGPFYYYWLAILSDLKLDEHSMRVSSLFFPMLTALAMYFGSLIILRGREGQIAAILAPALFLWSPITLRTTELAPHMLFELCYVSALLLLARAAAGGGRRYYYAAVVCTGLAFCTLEVALVLVFVMLVFAWWRREALGSDWRLARNAVALFVVTVLVIWPAAIVKLSFPKAYMVMAFLAIFRKGAWGDVTFVQTWGARFLLTPVEWVLILLALVLLISRRNQLRVRRSVAIFLLFAGLMILATLKVYADGPRYMTPFFAALELFAAWMLAPLLGRLNRPWMSYGIVAAIAVLLFWNSSRQLSTYMPRQDHREADTLAGLRASGLADKTVLAPAVEIPTLHYYFPKMDARPYADVSVIPLELSRRRFDAVLYPDYSLKTNPRGFNPAAQ